jgi:thiamine-phosphate pyrophosphorylase
MPLEASRWRGLYAITAQRQDDEVIAREAAACLEGGAAMLQYRAKSLSPGTMLSQARRLKALCAAHQVPFIVNDSVALALAVGADGVHVGREDGGIREARIAMPRGIVGASCYADAELARAAAREGADYVAVGSVFASTTKPQARPAMLEAIAHARAASGLPVVAIGGITLANVGRVIDAGADMAAIISAVFDSGDPLAAARAFQAAFGLHPSKAIDAGTQPQAL